MDALASVRCPVPLGIDHLDAIKTALTVAAGLGAGVTLLVALRRQSISERAQRTAERAQRHVELAAERSHRLAEQDAAERRITELYVAAVEQLGSDKAPVRLGGLYALERIGNDHSKMRQTIMDVWCAYLRMPYIPPADVLRGNAKRSPLHLAPDADEPEPMEQPERRQELQVRLTAQRLIRIHLYAPSGADTEPAEYWRGPGTARMNLDLTGAALIDLTLQQCQLDMLTAANAQFHGEADLSGGQFHGEADLSGGQFHRNADLRRAQFHGRTVLRRAQFHGNTFLRRAQFHGEADLSGVQFHGTADLSGAQFHQNANLNEALFHAIAFLSGVQFYRYAYLNRAQFHDVDLSEAQFHRYAYLSEAQFHRTANLSEAQFHRDTDLSGAQFHQNANLSAQFGRAPLVKGMRVKSTAVLPDGWTSRTEPDPSGLIEVLTATVTPGPDDQRPQNDSTNPSTQLL